MSDMVERVAGVLFDEISPRCLGWAGKWSDPEPGDEHLRDIWRAYARKIIVAMREPVVTMSEEGLTAIQDNMDSTQDSYSSWDYPTLASAYHCWQAMIDEAGK